MRTYCIDVDGCLADFNTAFGRLMEQVSHGRVPAPVGPPKTWHWLDQYPADAVAATWEVAMSHGTFWRGLEALPGTGQLLRTLTDYAREGHDVYFVTARPGHQAKRQTESWLVAHGMVRPTVLISHEKGHTARGLRTTVFLDDKPDNHRDVLRQCGSSCRCLLLDQPWNRDWNHPYVTRVFSLDHAL